jgi:long-chain fatty acid transport protein
MKTRTLGLAVLGAAILMPISTAYSVGFRLPNQSPKGIARGNAFVATADDASAIYYNPAGLTQLQGNDLILGTYLISTNTEFEDAFGRTAETDGDFQLVPQFHYAYSYPDNPLAVGVGVYAPYGLGIDYGEDTPFSTLGTSADLIYLTFHPVVAVQLTSELSFGIGPTLNYGDVTLERRVGLLPGDRFEFEGDDQTVGFTAGLLWQPSEQWSFGLTYRSPTTMDFEGQSITAPFSGYTPTSGSLDFPANIDFGISYRPTPQWNIEVNVDWTDWDTVNSTRFVGTFAGDAELLFNYTSSFMYEFGLTRAFDNGVYLSAGYIYSENSAPDANFTPLNPDADLHLGSLGVGWEGENWGVHLGYHFAYNGGREVVGNTSSSLIGETADGRYETLNHAVSVALRFKF